VSPEEIRQLLAQARAAREKGFSLEQVNARIVELTNGEHTGMASLAVIADEEKPITTRDIVRSEVHGATFGFGDELRGLAAAAVPGGQGYAEARDDWREAQNEFRRQHPYAAFGSEMVGGLLVPVGGGAKLAQGLARPGAGLLARMGAGAVAGGAVGAGAGALVGAGESEADPLREPGRLARDVAIGTGIGLGVGGVTGGVLPAVGAAAGKTSRFARELIAPEAAAKAEARRTLRRTLEASGLTPREVEARLIELGPEGVIADVDPVLAREARAASNQAPSLGRTGGPVDEIASRAESRGDRLAASLRRAAGIGESYDDAYKAAEAARKRISTEHYQPLEGRYPAVDDPEIARLMQEPGIANILKRVAPEVYNGNRQPSFMELQEVRMILEDLWKGAKGRYPNRANTYRTLHNEFRDAMEEAMPGFAEAQKAYRAASERLRSFKSGYDMWNKPAREQANALAELSPEAQEAFRIGLLTRWEEALLTREGGGAAAGRLMAAGDEMKAQLLQLFGGEEGLANFLATRDIEGSFAVTNNWLRGNSTTAMQLSDALESAPMSRSALLNKVWNALFSPGEARRMQAEQVGRTLLGRDIGALEAAQRGPLYRTISGAAQGAPAGGGATAARVGARSGFQLFRPEDAAGGY
jgi:hypothetical protein